MSRFAFHLVASAVLTAFYGCAQKDSLSQLKDGEYHGYELLPNLTQTEDPEGYWYYAGVLSINKGSVTLKQAPRHMSHGKVSASASDGGFPEYDGKVVVVGERTLVTLRKVACDYCGESVSDPLPSKIEREYVVRFISDNSFELNRVTYSNKPDPKHDWKAE